MRSGGGELEIEMKRGPNDAEQTQVCYSWSSKALICRTLAGKQHPSFGTRIEREKRQPKLTQDPAACLEVISNSIV